MKGFVECNQILEGTKAGKIMNISSSMNKVKGVLKYCTPNLKLACFVCYLKIINTFLKNNACILK